MKYTARHIQRFLETGRIDATLWKNHFPSLLPTQVPACDDCTELKDRTCAGGRDPVECFLAKAPAAEPGRGAPAEEAGSHARPWCTRAEGSRNGKAQGSIENVRDGLDFCLP